MSLTKVSYSMINGAPFNVLDYGAKGDGVSNDSDAIQATIDAAALYNLQDGAVVYFPPGVYLINKTINMPNRIALQGANGRASHIKAFGPFTGQAMFYANNGTTSMFGSRITDMFIDARNVNITAAVSADAWQETCGMQRVLLYIGGTTQFGLTLQFGYGGASFTSIVDCEIFCDTTNVNACGIIVNQISSVGGFVLSVSGISIVGSVANPLPNGIAMQNDSLIINTYHVEHCLNMIAMNGVGSLSADTLTGSGENTVDMVSIGSGFTGQVNMRNIIPNGATGNIFVNNITGLNISTNEEMLAQYIYQPSAFSARVSTQINNVTGNGTVYDIVFNSEDYDYLSEYNNASGVFTAKRAGKYLITTQVGFTVTPAVSTCTLTIATSVDEYFVFIGDTDNIYSSSNIITLNGSCIVSLNAAQTVRVVLTITGLGADTVDILADKSKFAGHWLSR